uniref:BPI2 domain-containing protein n=1 Tax=Romanomermis culicivorax TaxID=13658 RepID=A0A915HHY7_ROMCU
MVLNGGAFIGKTLLFTTPFLSRLPMQGFIVYDLVQQVNRYKSGDKDAKVNIIGDSTILATEFVTASIDGAAALGYLTTAAEFTVQNLMQEKQIADTSAKNAFNFFREHPYVKNYIFPKYRFEGDNVAFMNNNYANLNIKIRKWNRVWPVDMPRLRLTCSPYSFKVKNTDHDLKTRKILHECQDMFGYENLNNTLTIDITVILLDAGNDTLECAPSRNTIIIGDGLKNITGNTDIDTFILQGNSTYGIFNGMSGDDILNLNNYALNRGLKLKLESDNGTVSNLKDEKEIQLKQIHNLIEKNDILMQIFYKSENQQDVLPLINITMKNVDFDHLIVINLRRPMQVSYTKDGRVNLTPTAINKYNSSYISINVLEIEADTEIISYKSMGADYDTFIMQNSSLLITNSQYIEKEEDLVVVHLKDFFKEVEMQTLSLIFRDKIIRLEEQVDELNESEVLEDAIDDADFSNLILTAIL